MEDFERLKQVVADAETDVAKCEAGNKAAGTRVRKAMMEIKKIAQAIRVQISGSKKAAEPARAATAPASGEPAPGGSAPQA